MTGTAQPPDTLPLMIEEYRKEFNRRWSPDLYRRLLGRLESECRTHIAFPVSETPVFLPPELLRLMEQSGREMITSLLADRSYLASSSGTIPERYRVPREPLYPLFSAVDFGIIQREDGSLAPRLIELQGFPSLYAYQTLLAAEYSSVYQLDERLTAYPPDLDAESYGRLFRNAVLGDCDPENVVLLEIDPMQQKTLPDFAMTERICGVTTLNIRDVRREGRTLLYARSGQLTPIRRIYNRTIVEDLEKSHALLSFRFDEDLDVEWAGHPNWFFRLSKYALPSLHHPCAPRTIFLADLDALPGDLSGWVLKPLFSFAGSGVNVSPTKESLSAIPRTQWSRYVLQEKVTYAEVVKTPQGNAKAEVRIMYIWNDGPVPVMNLVRMGRGAMMGVDHNKNLSWVGGSAGFWPRS